MIKRRWGCETETKKADAICQRDYHSCLFDLSDFGC